MKICGNTSLDDARLAVDAGADALGFIFAPSPRQMTAEQVAAITGYLPDFIEKIGVFVDASPEVMVATARRCGLTGVQLHADARAEVPARLRKELGGGLRILRVVHFGVEAAEQAGGYAADQNVDGVLVDSRTATAVGGTGIAYDWNEAGRTVFGGGAARLVAAGGLNPENVAEAIRLLRPWGVDVASGVEVSPGRKDPEKVRAFVAQARAAGGVD
ncbi:MAG TPA: phosphoribosylanthranilate isomerase [Terracidiphilus sp.]